MNIGLFTDTYYPEINGVANSVFQLKKELEARGNQVYVFTVSNPHVTEKEEHVYRMKSVPFVFMPERRVSYSIARRWYPLIQQLNLDVIHTHTEFMVGHIGRKAAERFHIPLVHTYHTIYEDYTHYLKVPGNEKFKGMIRKISRICCNHADCVIVPTEKVQKLLVSYGVTKPVTVQPTGINLSKFALVDYREVNERKAQYGLTDENHVLISIGRVSQEKNLSELIRFTEKMAVTDPQIRLLIVGDGPERSTLENYVREKHLTQYVRFAGEAPWSSIQNYYALGDVFVSASTSETQGLTYAEALAAGKPLLVRRDECLTDILHPGVNGYAYEDEHQFEMAYSKLFEKKHYLQMLKAARESIAGLSSGAFGQHVERIYQELDMRRETYVKAII